MSPPPSVARPSQVYFGGVVKGESAVKTEEEMGSLINYEFRVRGYTLLGDFSHVC